MMSEPPRHCPRCFQPAMPAIVRCQGCGQVLSRPTSLPSAATVSAERGDVGPTVEQQRTTRVTTNSTGLSGRPSANSRSLAVEVAPLSPVASVLPLTANTCGLMPDGTHFVSGKALAAGDSPENVDPNSPVASAKPLKASAIGLMPPRSAENQALASSEKLRVVCSCGASIRVGTALLGKRIKCPKCSAAVAVSTTLDHKHSSPKAVPPPVQRHGENTVAECIAIPNHESGERVLREEIELAANRSATPDVEATPRQSMSFVRIRKLRKLLETANVLSDTDNIARRNALLELGQSRDSRALPILVDHAQDLSSLIREAAITALGDWNDPQAVPTLIRALLDRNAEVVRAVFSALKKIGDRRIVRPLLRFGQEHPEWRPSANDTLVRLGTTVVQELLSILQSDEPGLTLEAIVVLGRIGDQQAVPALIACLDHVSNLLKAHVTEALALIGDSRAVPHLLRALEDPHTPTRANAAAGLVRMADPRSVRPLLNALRDNDCDVRVYAAIALGELGDPKAVPDLTSLLDRWKDFETEESQFLEAVIESLGMLGDTMAVPALIPLLQSRRDSVLLKTVVALKKLRDPSAAQAMQALLHSPLPTVRRRVLEALGQSGDVLLVSMIGESLRRDDAPEVRAAAAQALGALKDRTACGVLEEALRDADVVRCQAVIALGAIHDKSSLPALMAMLKDTTPEVRYHAVHAIGKFKNPKTLKAMAVLLEDSDSMVRNGASQAIAEFGEEIEDSTVQEIVRRVRNRDRLANLIPNWVLLFVPSSQTARRTLAAILAASLLLGFVIKSTIGSSGKIHVRGNVQALTLNSDGSRLVAERTFGMLEVWNVNSQSIQTQVAATGFRQPWFVSDDRVVLLSGPQLVPWMLKGSPEVAQGWQEHKQPILRTAVTPDGQFAVTVAKDLIAVTWDLRTGKKLAEAELSEQFPEGLTISHDGQRLASSNRRGEIAIIEADGGKPIVRLSSGHTGKPIAALDFSPDDKLMIAIDNTGGLRHWTLSDAPDSSKLIAPKTPLRVVRLRVLNDSRHALTADNGGEVRVWDLEAGNWRTVCSGDIDQLDGFALSADEKRIALGGNSNSVILVYDLDSGELLKSLDVRGR